MVTEGSLQEGENACFKMECSWIQNYSEAWILLKIRTRLSLVASVSQSDLIQSDGNFSNITFDLILS